MRLQDLHALSDVRRVPERAISSRAPGSRGSSIPRTLGRTSSIRTDSISTKRCRRSRSAQASSRCSCSSTRRTTISREDFRSGPTWRRNGASSATGRRSTSICGDRYERDRLSGLRGAARARLPRRAVPDRALRRSSAVLRAQHDRSGQDDTMIARRVAASDPRFLTTYYAIDTINFTPRDVSRRSNAIDAPTCRWSC